MVRSRPGSVNKIGTPAILGCADADARQSSKIGLPGLVLRVLMAVGYGADGARKTLMDNPWPNLPEKEPFVLEGDKELILAFNDELKNDKIKYDKYMIHLDLLPEPYLGNPNAEIVLLNLNPGFSPDDSKLHHSNKDFINASRTNLGHGKQEYPFYFLDPRVVEARGRDSRGRDRWWNRKLGHLVEVCGASRVANNVFCIEFFPYHSKEYKGLPKRYNSLRGIVPSQHYSFDLVRKAIQRRALIVFIRSRAKWSKAVPELADYRYCYQLNSPQSGSVTKGNLELGGFERIVEILKSRGVVYVD
jgi:hypothetical protein